jgi:hypothetical protein
MQDKLCFRLMSTLENVNLQRRLCRIFDHYNNNNNNTSDSSSSSSSKHKIIVRIVRNQRSWYMDTHTHTHTYMQKNKNKKPNFSTTMTYIKLRVLRTLISIVKTKVWSARHLPNTWTYAKVSYCWTDLAISHVSYTSNVAPP